MSIEAQQLEFKKHNHYRDRYYQILRWIVLLAISAVVFTVVLAYMNMKQSQPNYYATTTSGQTIPLHPLGEPVVTNKYILQWASIATRKALNLDFVNYESQLNSVQSYFTVGGWNKFKIALKTSGLLNTVISKKLEMSAVVSGAPLIVNRSVFHGRFTWTIQLPVLITFTSASENKKSSWIVTMDVQRVPVLDTAAGIQISNFITMQPIGQPSQ